MTKDAKRLVQAQFGEHASKFVASRTHAQGYSLQRLVELVSPRPDWLVIDVATGGGHTALAFAKHVDRVVACDLTSNMLGEARTFVTKQITNISFCRLDAEFLPFRNAFADCVTCRIAPHHFSDVESFVRETWRILKPGGVIALADNTTPGEPSISNYINSYETLRDPSHHWAHSLVDWEVFLAAAGFDITHCEEVVKNVEFEEWAARVGVERDRLLRLRVMIQQMPKAVTPYIAPKLDGDNLTFKITEGIVIGQKT